MKTFSAEILADSINPNNNRVTTFLITYPRFILAELNTHRMLSKNSSSSRAIPIEKVIEQVSTNPAFPIRWGKNGKGMQDHGEFTEFLDVYECTKIWKMAADEAILSAKNLAACGLHKQISNRVLEPWVWMTTIISGTEWENFFALRCHKDAQPEFSHLAYLMLKKYVNNTPSEKQWGEWHIPYGDRMPENIDDSVKMKVATARAARTSYLTMDGKIDVEKDIKLHDQLMDSGHWSPFEHSAMAEDCGMCGNFNGWKQYRKFFAQENKRCDLNKLLEEYEKSL